MIRWYGHDSMLNKSSRNSGSIANFMDLFLDVGMILSTLGKDPHGFVYGFSKKTSYKLDIVHPY